MLGEIRRFNALGRSLARQPVDPALSLRDFLDRNAATMPRTALRYAIERLPSDARDYYLNRKKGGSASLP